MSVWGREKNDVGSSRQIQLRPALAELETKDGPTWKLAFSLFAPSFWEHALYSSPYSSVPPLYSELTLTALLWLFLVSRLSASRRLVVYVDGLVDEEAEAQGGGLSCRSGARTELSRLPGKTLCNE